MFSFYEIKSSYEFQCVSSQIYNVFLVLTALTTTSNPRAYIYVYTRYYPCTCYFKTSRNPIKPAWQVIYRLHEQMQLVRGFRAFNKNLCPRLCLKQLFISIYESIYKFLVTYVQYSTKKYAKYIKKTYLTEWRASRKHAQHWHTKMKN